MLTILIPTYNRETFLQRLFLSLDEQTDKNFNVLIMDDGSNDCTKSLCDKWSKKLEINYYYHDNIGKSKTLVESLKYLQEDYVYLLDSDSILKSEAVKVINGDLKKFDNNKRFGGLFYCMEYPNGKVIGNKFKNPNVYTNFQTALDFDAKGDKAVIIRTTFLKQIEMPTFINEKFITESVFMNRLSLICQCVCRNTSIMVTDYQDDGLTANIKEFWKLYPNGYYLFFLERINDHKLPLVKYCSSLIALSIFAMRTKIGYNSTRKRLKGMKNKLFFILAFPVGYICDLFKIM